MNKGGRALIATIVRTFTMYIFVVAVLRIMGKRQIGELEASELVVTIIISDIAAMPITNTEASVSVNIIAILTLMVMELILSYLAYKITAVRTVLYGRPSTFYKNGKFNQKEMLRQRFNVADIMEELRGNGICTLDDVEYIVMETNGNVSVILKEETSPVTPKQINIKTNKVRMSYIIVDNGTIVKSCMKNLGLNKEWLNNKMKEYGIKKAEDIFYMSFEEESGKTVIIPKD